MAKLWRLFDTCVFFVMGYLLLTHVGGILDIQFPRRFGQCVSENALRVIQQVDLHQCVTECSIRKACSSVSYRLARLECKLLSDNITQSTTYNYDHDSCMNVNKHDVIDINGALYPCVNCNFDMACNISSGGCYYGECSPLTVANADVQCHMTNVGASASISCNYDSSGHFTNIRSVCQSDGSWSNIPSCPTLQECSTTVPMVTGNGGISDSQITATSEYTYYAARYGRLHDNRAWAALTNETGEYIQYDFITNRIIEKVQTQGRCCPDEWVTSFKIRTSMNCVDFTAEWNIETFNHQIFIGNIDPNSVVENTLLYPVLARCVRFYPRTWKDWPTMRVEIFGCTL